MTIFILLGAGLFFLFITSVLIGIDNKKRRTKRKMIGFKWKVMGIVFAILAFTNLIIFGRYCYSFGGTECGERKILLRTTMDLTEITIPSEDAVLEHTLKQDLKKTIEEIESGKGTKTIRYTDALLNRKDVPISKIHEVKYSDDLSKKQVQIVEYLVNTKKGVFTKPQIYYYIIFSTQIQTGKKGVKTKKTAAALKSGLFCRMDTYNKSKSD